jgi:hypothetical protein
MNNLNLKNLLADWTDPDIAEYYLACCLGLMVYDDSFMQFREAKYVFWTQNPTKILLDEMLETMVKNKILEFDDDESKYRWNKTFKGDWEIYNNI